MKGASNNYMGGGSSYQDYRGSGAQAHSGYGNPGGGPGSSYPGKLYDYSQHHFNKSEASIGSNNLAMGGGGGASNAGGATQMQVDQYGASAAVPHRDVSMGGAAVAR